MLVLSLDSLYTSFRTHSECVRAAKRAHDSFPEDYDFAINFAMFLDKNGIIDESFSSARRSCELGITVDTKNKDWTFDIESELEFAEAKAFVEDCMNDDGSPLFYKSLYLNDDSWETALRFDGLFP